MIALLAFYLPRSLIHSPPPPPLAVVVVFLFHDADGRPRCEHKRFAVKRDLFRVNSQFDSTPTAGPRTAPREKERLKVFSIALVLLSDRTRASYLRLRLSAAAVRQNLRSFSDKLNRHIRLQTVKNEIKTKRFFVFGFSPRCKLTFLPSTMECI